MQCRYILLYVFIFSVSFTHLGANLQGTKISIPKNRNLFCKLVPCKEQPLYYFLLDGNNMRSLDNYLTILGKKDFEQYYLNNNYCIKCQITSDKTVFAGLPW